MLLGVEEPLSASVFNTGSPETVRVEGEVVSSFTSISVLDWNWRMALPFEERIYRGIICDKLQCDVLLCCASLHTSDITCASIKVNHQPIIVIFLLLTAKVWLCLLWTYLIEFCLRLSQSNFVFHDLSLHLLVVGLQRAYQMAHLSVNRA